MVYIITNLKASFTVSRLDCDPKQLSGKATGSKFDVGVYLYESLFKVFLRMTMPIM